MTDKPTAQLRNQVQEDVELKTSGLKDENPVAVSDIPTDPETLRLERKLKWKLDLFILPLISMVYFFSFMVYIFPCTSVLYSGVKLTKRYIRVALILATRMSLACPMN